MTKGGPRFYAVRTGREGPTVYTNWDEALRNTDRFPGAVQKSFKTRKEADEWIGVHPALLGTYQDGPPVVASQAVASSSKSSSMHARNAQMEDTLQIKRDLENDYDMHVLSSPVKTEHTVDWGMPSLASQSSSGQSRGAQSHNGDNIPYTTTNSGDPRSPPLGVIEGVDPAAPPVKLSDEQRAVLDMVKRGKNVFFTGSAGTGKSVLLREIIKHCQQDAWEHGRLAITASTGIASVNIGGSTLHSWAGIGLGKETAERLVGKILGQMIHAQKLAMQQEQLLKKQRGKIWRMDEDVGFRFQHEQKKKNRTAERWKIVRTLIIDEISMIDGVLFDKLEYIARALRENSAPFGGIQLVLSGDFCQLPPVPDHAKGAQQPPIFAFDAESWERCVGRPVVLTKVFRQKDQTFVDMLNEMRFGRLDPATILKFRDLSRSVTYDDGLEPTDLFPTRRQVDGANNFRLNKIKENDYTYNATDVPGFGPDGKPISLQTMERLLERLIAPKVITLKAGAQVMLIKNMVQGSLVNGSLGRVISFMTAREAVHDGIPVSLTHSAEEHNRDGTPRVPESLMRENSKWPYVRFQNGASMLCVPVAFEVNDAEGNVEAGRGQIPLILAWALSIHKSQGQTLQRVRVNLGRIFEKGQAYVALSRATSMETLQVLNFDPAKVMAHPRVMAWMAEHTDTHYYNEIDETLEFWADL